MKKEDCPNIMDEGSLAVYNNGYCETETSVPTPAFLIRRFWKLPIMPIVWLPFAISLLCNSMIFIHALFIVFGLLLTIVLLASSFVNIKMLSGPVNSLMKWLYSFGDQKLWYMDKNEMELIACSKDKKAFNFKNLPSNHKTVRLRFQDLKSKVCKPFSL